MAKVKAKLTVMRSDPLAESGMATSVEVQRQRGRKHQKNRKVLDYDR